MVVVFDYSVLCEAVQSDVGDFTSTRNPRSRERQRTSNQPFTRLQRMHQLTGLGSWNEGLEIVTAFDAALLPRSGLVWMSRRQIVFRGQMRSLVLGK